MSTTEFLRILCVGLVATMIFSLTPAMSQPTPEQQELINASLEDFALILSDALSQEANQNYVWDTISTSRNEEMIVDLEALASAAPRPGGQGGIWDELEGAIVALHDDLAGEDNDNIGIAQEPNDTPPLAIDLYFPVEEHRKKWDGTAKNLFVAYAPVGDEEDVESIIAYSAETGEAVILDPNIEPDEDHLTLIVGLDEAESLEPAPPLMEMAPPVDADDDPLEVDVNDTNSYIGVPWIYLVDDNEPWWKGRAEIYALVGQIRDGKEITHKKSLRKVDYDKRWYYLGDGPGNILYFYWDSRYNPLTYFRFYESDGGWSVNVKVTATISDKTSSNAGKVEFNWTMKDNDDKMGHVWVDRNSVPWTGTRRFSTGDVRIDVDKDH